MIIGGFVSHVEFVVFGKFAGFDAVLGQDWLRQHQCVLEMGTGRVIIKTDSRKFVLSSIATKNKAAAYNRTPVPPTTRVCPIIQDEDEDDTTMPTEISGNACARLFNFMKPKYKSKPPKFEKAYLCLTALSGDVLYESIPGKEGDIKEIIPIIPDEPKIGQGISNVNEDKLSKLLKKYNSQFGEYAPTAENRPTATKPCIQTDPDAAIPNKPLRRYNPGENSEIKTQVDKVLQHKIIRPSTSPYGSPILMIKKKTGG